MVRVFFTLTLLLSLAAAQFDSRGDTLSGFVSSTWPDNVIPYRLDSSLESYEQERIKEVTNRIAQSLEGCITFQENYESTDYLNFVRAEHHCRSEFIGFVGVGAQNVFLAQNCSLNRYVYWVVLQALGLPAEHMRPDRDNYILIKWENVDNRYRHAFKKYTYIDERLSKLPYDMESRMHYSSDKFSIVNGQKTIVDVATGTAVLGNGVGPTAGDYEKLAALYCESFPPPPPPPTVFVPSGLPAGIAVMNMPDALQMRKQQWLFTNCPCREQPDEETGSCTDRGFQFIGMYAVCRNPRALDKICLCEDGSSHPCWCQADYVNNRCKKICLPHVL